MRWTEPNVLLQESVHIKLTACESRYNHGLIFQLTWIVPLVHTAEVVLFLSWKKKNQNRNPKNLVSVRISFYEFIGCVSLKYKKIVLTWTMCPKNAPGHLSNARLTHAVQGWAFSSITFLYKLPIHSDSLSRNLVASFLVHISSLVGEP